MRSTVMTMDWIAELHGTLDKRATTAQVAAILKEGARQRGIFFGPHDRQLLHLASGGARARDSITFMPDDFERSIPATRQLAFVQRMFPGSGIQVSPDDANGLLQLTQELGVTLGWNLGSDWLRDRLSARELHARYPGLSRRQYNRSLRALVHLEAKARAMGGRQRQRELVQISHSGLAYQIPLERFRADPDGAAFVAYFTARRNRRRQFALEGKENPLDQLAVRLLARCKVAFASADWYMIALAYPDAEVLAYLSDTQLGQLAGTWFYVMRETAGLLSAEWKQIGPGVADRRTMVVRRGMNSSGWNELAGAYNAARTGWLNCTLAVCPQLIDAVLPGKVMRLMAADLVRWHAGTGGDVDPNTAVWGWLPLPWDVLRPGSRVLCTRQLVEATCRSIGLDPAASGWTGHRVHGQDVAAVTLTPELVHGVEIADPVWAQMLRRAGVFSAKKHSADARALRLQAERSGVVTGPLPSHHDLAADLPDSGEYV